MQLSILILLDFSRSFFHLRLHSMNMTQDKTLIETRQKLEIFLQPLAADSAGICVYLICFKATSYKNVYKYRTWCP